MAQKVGIKAYYFGFLRQLKKDKKRFAYLQLIAKNEEDITKWFSEYIFRRSEGRHVAITNFGKSKERKFDLVVIDFSKATEEALGRVKEYKDSLRINYILEAKYFRNRHRFSVSSATDEISGPMKTLKKQCEIDFEDEEEPTTHGGYKVKLLNHKKDVLGLVYCSFVSLKKNDPKKNEFFSRIRDLGKDHFRSYHYDKPGVNLNTAYNDCKIRLGNVNYYCTFKLGFWRNNDVDL